MYFLDGVLIYFSAGENSEGCVSPPFTRIRHCGNGDLSEKDGSKLDIVLSVQIGEQGLLYILSAEWVVVEGCKETNTYVGRSKGGAWVVQVYQLQLKAFRSESKVLRISCQKNNGISGCCNAEFLRHHEKE